MSGQAKASAPPLSAICSRASKRNEVPPHSAYTSCTWLVALLKVKLSEPSRDALRLDGSAVKCMENRGTGLSSKQESGLLKMAPWYLHSLLAGQILIGALPSKKVRLRNSTPKKGSSSGYTMKKVGAGAGVVVVVELVLVVVVLGVVVVVVLCGKVVVVVVMLGPLVVVVMLGPLVVVMLGPLVVVMLDALVVVVMLGPLVVVVMLDALVVVVGVVVVVL